MQFIEWARSHLGNVGVWIGLTDRREEGTFVWASGRELSADVSAHLEIKWQPGEKQRDCAAVKTIINGGIQDMRCGWERNFVCQKL